MIVVPKGTHQQRREREPSLREYCTFERAACEKGSFLHNGAASAPTSYHQGEAEQLSRRPAINTVTFPDEGVLELAVAQLDRSLDDQARKLVRRGSIDRRQRAGIAEEPSG
jgi:hypothetical protein